MTDETFNAVAFAQFSVSVAFDDPMAYGGIENALWSHFDNMRDTLNEYHVTGDAALEAERAYHEAVAARIAAAL